jgi:hypothetical protein
MRVKMSFWDIVVIAAICIAALLIALVPLFAQNEGSFVKVTAGLSAESVLLPLEEDGLHTFESNGHALTIEIKEGSVSVIDATCPDRVCISSGRISRGGEIIVCVPSMITIEILSENEEADYVVG